MQFGTVFLNSLGHYNLIDNERILINLIIDENKPMIMMKTPRPLSADTMSDRELTSIKALLAFMAHDHNISEESVREAVTSHFGVDDVKNLPRQKYDDVIRFLVDIQVDMSHPTNA